jgi:creatinine amidohydrolase
MRIEDLNWMDVEKYLEADDRLILVIGSCEQHGYLSLLTDVKIPLALADAASRQTGVLVAPPMNFGCSPYFLSFPGTFSLRITTLLDVVEDFIISASEQGFHNILVLNGHGGNEPVRARIYEILNNDSDINIQWFTWFQSQSVSEIAKKYELKPSHANWLEAFSFSQVADLPDIDKAPPYVPGLLSAEKTRTILGDGSFGGPYSVEDNIMDEIFSAALQDVIHLLQHKRSSEK